MQVRVVSAQGASASRRAPAVTPLIESVELQTIHFARPAFVPIIWKQWRMLGSPNCCKQHKPCANGA